MGLTERHWFENEDVPENYERDLEDAVYNSLINKKRDDIVRCKDCVLRFTERCVLHDQAFPVYKGNEWFCADGKRRETNDK